MLESINNSFQNSKPLNSNILSCKFCGAYYIKSCKTKNSRNIEGNKKRDLNNVSFAKKFILDSMVKTGKLQDDKKNYVRGFKDTFEYGKTTKIIVEIEEV